MIFLIVYLHCAQPVMISVRWRFRNLLGFEPVVLVSPPIAKNKNRPKWSVCVFGGRLLAQIEQKINKNFPI